MLQAGDAELLLSTGSHLGGTPQFTGTLYFHMVGVQAFFERVKNQAEVVWPLETMEYGQTEFGIKDCEVEGSQIRRRRWASIRKSSSLCSAISGWTDRSWPGIAGDCSPRPAATFWKSASAPA
jgi:hypothetical protein